MIIFLQILLVLMEGRDYKIWLEAPIDFKPELTSIQESSIKYCVDFFRYILFRSFFIIIKINHFVNKKKEK